MRTSTLHFERVIDLPPTMVWRALVDEALLSGWLADASVDAREGGSVVFRWFDGSPSTEGAIIRFVPHEVLSINTDNRGTWKFELVQVPGGPRDQSTQLRLEVTGQRAVVAGPPTSGRRNAAAGAWDDSLVNLHNLMHGSPVDWYGVDGDEDDPGQAAPPAFPASS